MKVKEVADLAGVSVRTLHHYDDINLLKPSSITDSGYRIYSERDLEMLQQILFFRELEFPLKRIKEIMNSPSFNQEEALIIQQKMLRKKKEHINDMLHTIDKTIQHMKGERKMSEHERFSGFDFKNNPYEQEARERWGDQAVEESKDKINKMSEEGKQDLAHDFDMIYKKLAQLRHQAPDSEEAQAEIEEWYHYLNKIGTYPLDAFKGLGQMYVSDERFTKNIDRYGEGLAQFMCDAMAVYANRHS
ncbi:MerR family transcriptional regulator [Virgibacillus sp. MSJ-26]|uniref:MerR family transcriptional regulator n=1 Tax=Virgibacillus sp. MSJ-26 TaxID=2841522 RepID=UPI001C114166|nr:MerR family transcriptional regulator [Virgibacillus sp. MSJ-26]